MKKKIKRKCLNCKEKFFPDPRSADRQRYCSAPECKCAAKRARQQKWLNKPENQDYFKGPDQVARVQHWRKDHPGYWRKNSGRDDALQDDCTPQPTGNQQDNPDGGFDALQDDLLTQPVVILGLISYVTGFALQDDIVPLLRKCHDRGRMILGKACHAAGVRPGSQPKGNYETQKTPPSRPPAPSACAVQLDRSSSGP